MKVLNNVICVSTASLLVASTNGFAPQASSSSTSTELSMGLFDNFKTGGSGRDRLDDEWEKQQEILAGRRAPKSQRDAYFKSIEKRREEASKERDDKWGWQTKNYKKGEDPLNEWKKRRAEGTISDLNDQYGDPKKVGGIPLPMASFGVGGEFGVGGKYDNGGRFDLRLPYADQGYVDEDADFMGKLFGKKKPKKAPVEEKKEPEKKKGWFNF
eukprot:CAMPEP_0113640818 /NCGR_PEP_ID=MMETSP0017_2-20120614/21424_1 /TAXON_ID=2856 /ORGANISM="Cylindrotheca closterium" /LENGTH=212 /DNA_ID=CAMNT_0000552121 /DNA_START=54 /DNA_END=692 /DNA_ORIENTATION=- /assembly_acc=CAM_ASM_000147